METLEARQLLSAPLVQLTVTQGFISEGVQPLVVTIAAFCDHLNQAAFAVQYSVSPSSSTDFEVTGPEVTRSAKVGSWDYPGWRYAQLELHAKLDNEVEQSEPVTITLLPDPNGIYAIGVPGVPPEYAPPDAGIKTIQIIDSPPMVSIARLAHGSEDPSSGGSSTTPMRFEVTRTGGKTTESLTVSYSLSGTGTNPAGGGDYTAPSGQVIIPADALSAIFEVQVVDDTEIEAALEDAQVTLTGGGMGQSYAFTGFHPVNNPNPPAPTATATIQDNDFEIIGARILYKSQGLVRDNGNKYVGDQWDDVLADPGDRPYPISFQRSDAVTDRHVGADVVLHLRGNPTSPTYRLSGEGSGPGGGSFESDWQEVQWECQYDVPFLSWSVQSSERLPDVIDHGNLSVTWSVTPSNMPDKQVDYGTSTNNKIYVTGAEAPDEYETVLKIGCEAADGLRPPEPGELEPGASGAQVQIAEAIWSRFASRAVWRASGGMLEYDPGVTVELRQLLNGRTGACYAWSQLLHNTLQAQGVASSIVTVEPKSGFEMFRVATTDSETHEAGALGWAQGLTRLDSTDSEFQRHFVVRITAWSGVIYDPSLGWRSVAVGSLGADEMWENEQVVELKTDDDDWVPNDAEEQDLEPF